jgi:hypothetical protein
MNHRSWSVLDAESYFEAIGTRDESTLDDLCSSLCDLCAQERLTEADIVWMGLEDPHQPRRTGHGEERLRVYEPAAADHEHSLALPVHACTPEHQDVLDDLFDVLRPVLVASKRMGTEVARHCSDLVLLRVPPVKAQLLQRVPIRLCSFLGFHLPFALNPLAARPGDRRIAGSPCRPEPGAPRRVRQATAHGYGPRWP